LKRKKKVKNKTKKAKGGKKPSKCRLFSSHFFLFYSNFHFQQDKNFTFSPINKAIKKSEKKKKE